MSTYAIQIQVEGNAITGMKQIGAQIEQLNAKTKEIHSNFEVLKGKIGGLASEFKGLALGALGIGSAFAGFEFIKSSKEMFDKFEESVTKVETALTSTGHAAGLSLGQIEEEAKKLSGQTLFGRAAIMDAQSMLLTFTQIRGEIFNKSIPAVTDFATRFKMELPEAANMLGKALNDPLKGMTRLQRQGVVFSDQQKETIKHFMATGQVAKAQEVILKELGTEFGGLAHAMTQTDEGKLKMAAKTLDNFKLTVGELTSKFLVSLIPAFNAVVKAATKFKDWITGDSTSAEAFRTVLKVMGAMLVAYAGYLTVAGIQTAFFTAKQWLLNIAMDANPIGLIVMAIAALIAIVTIAIQKYDEWGAALLLVMGPLGMIVNLIMSFKKHWEEIKNAFSEEGIVGGLKKIGTTILDALLYPLQQALKLIAKLTGAKFIDTWAKDLQSMRNKLGINDTLDIPAGPGASHKNKGSDVPGAEGSLAQSAINTSALGGASGGLGEAKVIKIDFHKALMEVNVPGGNGTDIIGKGQLTVEAMLRIINNLSMTQGATM